jgi:putative chitinase
MTPLELGAAISVPPARAQMWADPLTAAMALYAIDPAKRQAAFLAQIGHESGRLIYVRELWGPTEAQRGYDQRADLGNTRPEAISVAAQHGSTPGPWWKGRGLIQTTGYDNHLACGDALGLDLLNHPELLEQPCNASLSAAWFWNIHGLNTLADIMDFETITRRINGGLNGFDDRVTLWKMARVALGVDDGT